MKKLKLSNLVHEVINEKGMSKIYGGGCTCGCFYANCGGSSVASNGSANSADNLHSTGGPPGYGGGPC